MRKHLRGDFRGHLSIIGAAAAFTAGAWALGNGVSELRALESGFCHNNPALCDAWAGYGCEGPCDIGVTICCQP
jgi:hypothetical protein